MTKNGQNTAKMEKIRNIQMTDNKEDKFFYFPMISMPCTGSGYSEILTDNDCGDFFISFEYTFCLMKRQESIAISGSRQTLNSPQCVFGLSLRIVFGLCLCGQS